MAPDPDNRPRPSMSYGPTAPRARTPWRRIDTPSSGRVRRDDQLPTHASEAHAMAQSRSHAKMPSRRGRMNIAIFAASREPSSRFSVRWSRSVSGELSTSDAALPTPASEAHAVMQSRSHAKSQSRRARKNLAIVAASRELSSRFSVRWSRSAGELATSDAAPPTPVKRLTRCCRADRTHSRTVAEQE